MASCNEENALTVEGRAALPATEVSFWKEMEQKYLKQPEVLLQRWKYVTAVGSAATSTTRRKVEFFTESLVPADKTAAVVNSLEKQLPKKDRGTVDVKFTVW